MGQDERELSAAEEVGAEIPTGGMEGGPGGVRERLQGLGGPTRLLLALALAVAVIYGMKYASGILNPIFLALFITMGASPALSWMRRRGFPTWLSLSLVILVIIVAMLLFLVLMVAMTKQLDDKLPVYQQNLAEMQDSVQAWFSSYGIDIGGATSGAFSPERIFEAVAGILSAGISMFSTLFLVILIMMFMVAEVFSVPERMTSDLKVSDTFRKSLHNFSDLTRTYLFTKAWLSFIVAVIVTVIYYAFGIDFALMWGLVFFAFSFIPNIGFVLSVIPPFFVGLLEFGFARAAIVVIIVIIVNTIVDNGLSPKIMGRSVGLSSLTVFLSLVFWGFVLGGIGALICVPMTLMVKLLFFDTYESTRNISMIMETPVTQMAKAARSGRKRGRAKAETG